MIDMINSKATKEEKILHYIECAIKEFGGVEKFREINSFVIIDPTETLKDDCGNLLNGKLLPKAWDQHDLVATAKRILSWLSCNAILPEHFGFIIAEATWTTSHCKMLRPEDRAYSITW
jgi:hypothetical protein